MEAGVEWEDIYNSILDFGVNIFKGLAGEARQRNELLLLVYSRLLYEMQNKVEDKFNDLGTCEREEYESREAYEQQKKFESLMDRKR